VVRVVGAELAVPWTTWRDKAKASLQAKRWDEAVAHFSKAIDLNPDDAFCWHFRGSAHRGLGQWDQALADYAKAAELKPTDPRYCTSKGFACAQLGQWERATATFEHTTTLQVDCPLAWYYLALVELQRGDRGRYRKVCARMLERFGQSTSTDAAYWTPWTCVLAPDAVADWTKPLQLAEKAHADDGKSYDRINHLGAVLYRAGRFKEATQRLTEAEAAFKQTPSTGSTVVYNWLFQAMAHHRLGHAAEAASWLEKAVQEIDQPSPETAQDKATKNWNRRLTLQLLRRDAEELLTNNCQ
jgi:tetratricopeptide (TPR) repeat protein